MATNKSKTNIDFVLKAARQHKCKFWRMWDSEGEALDKRESATIDLEASLAALKDAWEGVAGDYVKIRISPRQIKRGGDQVTDVYNYNVVCNPDAETDEEAAEEEEAPARTLSRRISAADGGLYTMVADLRVQLAKQEKDIEINELKRQLADKDKGGNKNKVLERFLEKMLDADDKKNGETIAGTGTGKKKVKPEAATETETAEPVAAATGDKAAAQKRLVDALNKLKAVDTDFIVTLEKIAAKAEKEPDMYNTYKAML